MVSTAVPTGTRVPFVAVAFDTTAAEQGPSVQPYNGLVIAQKTSDGATAELEPFTATSADEVRAAAGPGSVAHRMAEALFLNNLTIPWTFVLLDDAGGATAATYTLTVTGTATAGGTVFLYIGGERLEVGVTAGDTASDVATAIETAVGTTSTFSGLTVTAGAVAGVVTLTAKNAGTAGNEIDVRLNYLAGESLPDGIAIAVAAGASGATDPSVAGVWPVLDPDVQFNVWAVGLNTTAAIDAVELELEARSGPLENKLGVAFFAIDDSHANLVTAGSGQNSAFLSILGVDSSPSPTFEWAAAYAGQVAGSAKEDPARPLKTLPLVGILPPAEGADRFSFAERDLLLQNGISTFTVDSGSTVRIERAITTWQTSPAGAPSTAYLQVNTPLTLDFLRYDVRVQTANTFPRHKLSDDLPKGVPAGQPIVTPTVYRLFLIGLASGWQELGLVEGLEAFKRDLVVVRSSQDPNRLEVLFKPDLVNQFLILDSTAQFIL